MKTIKVAAAIIKDGDKILIAQRLKGEFAGQWEFPGGKVEPNESVEQALERELMEEMESKIQIDQYFMTAEYDYPTFHLSMDCFLCKLKSDEIHLHDHTAYQWLDIKDPIEQTNWIPADIQIIEKLKNSFCENVN